MATRMSRPRGRKVPSGAKPSARSNGKPASRGTNGKAAGQQAAWEGQRAAWEARYQKTGERPGLYPFTISGIPIKPLYTLPTQMTRASWPGW